MIYEKSKTKELSKELFENPTNEYRAAPFWAWNEKLKKDKLTAQIAQFREMGMGGFHIHCRVGLDTEYLGEEFFDCVQACEEEAKKEELLCYLYDEDRWPSGSAGGIVTKEQRYRTRFLVFSPVGYKEPEESAYMAAAKAVRSKNRIHVGYYQVELDGEGYLTGYQKKIEKPEKDENVWEAWMEISGNTPWFNNQAYVNTLDPEAIKKFIQVTHEEYFKRFGEDFGKEIKTIFTDEPQTTHFGRMLSPFEQEQVMIPFTDDFEETFQKEYGYSILEYLPEVFWERRNQGNYQVRYHYHRHVTERFARAFGDQIGTWCRDHNLGLTGHMLNEWTLFSQTLGVGEAMRPMKEFEIPGVDMLCDRREFSTVKQAQSVSRQCGREGVMSEIYGVTGWDFDFRNHKLAGDWQAALGVTLRVPHLTWSSMEGEAKRDYPACIGRHSPWYREYSVIEDHFARLNTVLTRGVPVVRVGVIHPIESYWMEWGNQEQTSVTRQVLEENFQNVIQWLLFGMIDFDFISEAMLAEDDNLQTGSRFCMGKMEYEVILVPECHTIRKQTYEKLKSFQKKGGRIIFMGEIPEFVDGKKDDKVRRLSENSDHISFNRGKLLEALQPYRDVDVEVFALDGEDPTRMKHVESGLKANNLFYQLRQDGENKWVFFAHVNKAVNEHIAYTERWKVKVRGEYIPVCYDSLTGKCYEMHAEYRHGNTVFYHDSSLQGSLLVKLEKGKQEPGKGEKPAFENLGTGHVLPEPIACRLEEENCCLLDQAEYAFDEGNWCESEELLRIDNLFREKLGYPLRMEALAQPWIKKEDESTQHVLKLRFVIESEIEKDEIFLAMEHPEKSQIFWNKEAVSQEKAGWYVDESIEKLRLPGLKKGTNILEIHMDFGCKTNVEWMYLLGSFGVQVTGKSAVITELPETVKYGNIVWQKLGFYGGNLIYETELETEEGELLLEISHYRGALVQISIDEKPAGNIFMAPYRISCGHVSAGKHKLAMKLFGNRINAFGAVHNANAEEKWYGPNLWRTTGNKWSYEYQLKETGILTSPVYWIRKENEYGRK